MRKTIQDQLRLREEETEAIIEKQRRDPRIYKVIKLADHWRKENEESDQRIQNLIADMNSVNMDMKVLERKMATRTKKPERMES